MHEALAEAAEEEETFLESLVVEDVDSGAGALSMRRLYADDEAEQEDEMLRSAAVVLDAVVSSSRSASRAASRSATPMRSASSLRESTGAGASPARSATTPVPLSPNSPYAPYVSGGEGWRAPQPTEAAEALLLADEEEEEEEEALVSAPASPLRSRQATSFSSAQQQRRSARSSSTSSESRAAAARLAKSRVPRMSFKGLLRRDGDGDGSQPSTAEAAHEPAQGRLWSDVLGTSGSLVRCRLRR